MNIGKISKKQKDVLKKTFGDSDIEDALANLLIIPNHLDVAGAVRGDPGNCAFSLGCRRMYGSTAAVFFRSVAYVDLPNEQGKRVLQRFTLPKNTRDAIEKFDKTGKFPLKGFVIHRPRKSMTLPALAQKARDYQKRIAEGYKPRATATGAQRAQFTKNALAMQGVRSGHGQALGEGMWHEPHLERSRRRPDEAQASD